MLQDANECWVEIVRSLQQKLTTNSTEEGQVTTPLFHSYCSSLWLFCTCTVEPCQLHGKHTQSVCDQHIVYTLCEQWHHVYGRWPHVTGTLLIPYMNGGTMSMADGLM